MRKIVSFLKPSGKALYKPLILLIATAIGILYANTNVADQLDGLFLTGFLTGLYQVVIALTLGNLVLKFAHKHLILKWLGILFAPIPNKSLGLLVSCLAVFTWLLIKVDIGHFNVFHLTYIGLSFISGSALGAFVYNLYGYKARNLPIIYQIENDRLDTFMGVIIAAVFLGTSFTYLPESFVAFDGNGGVFFPLFIAIAGLIITFIAAVLIGQRPKNRRFWVSISVFSAIFMMIIATELVITLLPRQWMIDGQEYTSSKLLLSIQLGLIAGLLSGFAVKFYQVISDLYIQFILGQTFKIVWVNVILRFFINVVFPFMPVILTSGALLISYAMAGMYGTSIAFLGLLSNVGVHLLIEENRLNIEQSKKLTPMQKQKVALLSPNFNQILMRMFGMKISKKKM
ncbi:MAG: sodium/proton-translocating pyrophosphatase [Flammeovirgaceae bacterium]